MNWNSFINRSVPLNKAEQRLTEYMQKCRQLNKRKHGTHDTKIGAQSNEDTDRDGFGAELAFCKLFNCYPDLSIEVRSSKAGTDRYDVEYNGWLIDVKTTIYPGGRLLVVPWKNEGAPPDYYALMVGQFPTYTFKGFLKASEMLQERRLGDLGRGPTYIAEQRELKTGMERE